ncbi:CobQ/CobB/MinD/ParA nucleotide binding domain protein [Enterococcus casseliflavus 14-MB-W-14]|nr:CobQ/CobB/MinD/ParA nucleotide binding domain protein [Enterococcus casseliflavus 14-MB-W-14]
MMTATTYTVGNFKGGVGKTKIVTMLAFDNAVVNNKKTLVIDIDPQANASQILARTVDLDHIDKTIVDGINEGDLSVCITPIMENLDLIACDTSFRSFSNYVITNFEDEKDQIMVLEKLLQPIKENYDSIFIDVPPTISAYSDNAMAASDYSIIAFQTQEESLDGISKYIGYQKFMINNYDIDLEVISIIACMLEPDDDLDKDVLSDAINLYGSAVSNNIVNFQKRLKRYSREGISLKKYRNGNYDQWDYRAHETFIKILAELESRRKVFEE